MSDSEWKLLLDADGWAAAEPPDDFAARVMARLAAPDPLRLSLVAPRPERASLSTLLFAAVAVAALVIFPLAIHLRTPARAPSLTAGFAAGASPDLGLERD